MRQFFWVITLLMIFFIAPLGRASETIVYPSLSYTGQAIDDNGSVTDTDNFYGDLRIGYNFDSGLYLGVLGSFISGVGNNDYTLSQEALGPTIGLIKNHFALTASWLPIASREYKNGNEYKYSSGSGFEAAIAYLFDVSSSLMIGPNLTLRQITYTKRQVNGGTTGDYSYTVQDVLPYVGLLFSF